LQYFDYHCAAATPPSKGGEFSSLCIYDSPLRLKAIGLGAKTWGQNGVTNKQGNSKFWQLFSIFIKIFKNEEKI